MKMPFIFLKEVPFSVTTNNPTSLQYCLKYEMHWELFSWSLENCQTSYPFQCWSWGLGCWAWYYSWLCGWHKSGSPLVLPERETVSHSACDAGLGQYQHWTPWSLEQDLGGTKVTKWQISIRIDRTYIILNACDFLFGCNSDLLYQSYKMGLMEKLCLHNNNNFILWNQFSVKEVLFKKVTLCSRA